MNRCGNGPVSAVHVRVGRIVIDRGAGAGASTWDIAGQLGMSLAPRLAGAAVQATNRGDLAALVANAIASEVGRHPRAPAAALPPASDRRRAP